jgi:hypothetical protein
MMQCINASENVDSLPRNAPEKNKSSYWEFLFSTHTLSRSSTCNQVPLFYLLTLLLGCFYGNTPNALF